MTIEIPTPQVEGHCDEGIIFTTRNRPEKLLFGNEFGLTWVAPSEWAAYAAVNGFGYIVWETERIREAVIDRQRKNTKGVARASDGLIWGDATPDDDSGTILAAVRDTLQPLTDAMCQ